MTVLTATRPVPALRALLLVDGAGTAALGAAALVAAEPLSDHVGSPGVLRAVGVLLLVVGADMLVTRRLSGRRLRQATVALGVADLGFAAACAASLPSTTSTGTALVVGIVAVCVGMGAAKLALSRQT